MSNKSDDNPNEKNEIRVVGDSDIEEDGGSSSEIVETYSVVLEKLGVSTKEMSVEDIKSLIHEYQQEGKLKGAKIIDFKTGKTKQTHKDNKPKGRTIKYKDTSSKPMTEAEFKAKKAEKEYKGESGNKDKHTVDVPFNPKPKGPGA